MPMRAKWEVHRVSRYLIVGAVWGNPSTQNISFPLPPLRLSIFCFNFERTIAEISIFIHFRTVAANSNNYQTHPVYNLLSTNEINPSENIFNNNVLQNGISKIAKSGRFSQFLKIGPAENFHPEEREDPATLHHAGGGGGENIRRYTPLQSGTEELLLSSRKLHPPVGQIWWEAGFFEGI